LLTLLELASNVVCQTDTFPVTVVQFPQKRAVSPGMRLVLQLRGLLTMFRIPIGIFTDLRKGRHQQINVLGVEERAIGPVHVMPESTWMGLHYHHCLTDFFLVNQRCLIFF
jgi:hypothetical protein